MTRFLEQEGVPPIVKLPGTLKMQSRSPYIPCLASETQTSASPSEADQMAGSKKSERRGFSIFRSAAEEAAMKSDEQGRENEGGHMSCTSGRVVSVPNTDKPFKVIMSREDGETSEHVFATMREAEAFVRRNTPRPPERSTTYDQGGNS